VPQLVANRELFPGVLAQTGKELGVHLGKSSRGIRQAFSLRVFPDGLNNGLYGGYDSSLIKHSITPYT
jgi:hypothetical protein